MLIRTLIFVALFIPFVLSAQTNNEKKMQDARTLFEKGEYGHSLKLYRELHNEMNKRDSVFWQVAEGISGSLIFMMMDAQKKNDWPRTISVAQEFIKVMDDDKEFIDPGLRSQVYWGYKNLIVAYNATKQHAKTLPYIQVMYAAYKTKQLPEGLEQYFNFEKIVYKKLNVWGYELYNEPDMKKDDASFSKQVYYVYSRDSAGNDKEQLYTLETVKVHKLKGDEPDFVLTKRQGGESQTLWDYTFSYPISYEKLHSAVMTYLGGGAAPVKKGKPKHK